MRLQGRVAPITGGGTGIGAAIAQCFVGERGFLIVDAGMVAFRG